MPIYNGTQKIDVSGVEKVYVGTQLVYTKATPYRRLEYIHLNGAEYINTELKPSYPKNRAIWIKADSDTVDNSRIIGAYATASADAARRYYFIANRESGFGFSIGNQWVGGKATSHLTDKVLLYGTINSTGATTSWGVKTPDDVTTYASGSLTTSSAIGQTANIFIGTNSNDAGNPDTSKMFKGNVYKYLIKTTNGSGPIETYMFPAQRKADGVCGLYDTMSDSFKPMIGTTITSGAAGPIVDENWDPSVKFVDNIKLSGQTTTFTVGDTFAFGGTVTANYSDGTTANVTNSTTFSGYNMNVAGTYTVTASYTENGITATATYNITVNLAWTTLWSGTATISKGGSQVFISNSALSELTGTTQFRITFTMSGSGGTVTYYNNGTSVSTKPTSPLEITTDLTGNKTNLVGVKVASSNAQISLSCGWSGGSYRRFYLTYTRSQYGSIDSFSATLTITKIEAVV